MRIITLDASHWTTMLDFCDALFAAIGAPQWHGKSPDAIIDSMIWGGINKLEPPYTVRIVGVDKAPKNVQDGIQQIVEVFEWGRDDYRQREGREIEVRIESVP